MTPTRELERAACKVRGSATTRKNAAVTVTFAPLVVKTTVAGKLIGGSRSEVYRLLRAGRLRAVKRGVSLLVLVDSLHEHIASLPPAVFCADREAVHSIIE
jgi:hypothetical protein